MLAFRVGDAGSNPARGTYIPTIANPRLSGYPTLNTKEGPYRMTPDLIHDYEYSLRKRSRGSTATPG